MPANYRYHIVQEFNEGKYPYIIASDTNDLIHEGEAEDEEPKKKKVRIMTHFYLYYCHAYLSVNMVIGLKRDFCLKLIFVLKMSIFEKYSFLQL
jgi:hypothetical protein